jgi:hypothetical protein
MITANPNPAAHAGEAQASNLVDPREPHWATLAVQLMQAARALADEYLQQQRDDIRVCASAAHHQAVRNLFDAIKGADRAGLEKACAEILVSATSDPIELWTVTGNQYRRCQLPAILAENDWLRPGDVIWTVQSAPQRHVLTEADFARAAPERDPRVPDMFETGGAA